MISLERRISVGLLVTLLLVMGGEFWLVHVGLQRLTADYVSTRVQHDAESLITALQHTADGRWTVNDQRLPTVYQRVHSGHYYRVRIDDQILRSRSLWDITLSLPALSPGESRTRIHPGPGDERWLSWTATIRKQGQAITLWVAEDLTPLDAQRTRFTLQVLALMAATLTLLLILQRWIVRRGFARLDPLRSAIRQLRSGSRSELDTTVPQEVLPLVEEIQRLLEQLGQRIQRSRTNLGNLAHELKRPLQRLRLLAERIPETDRQELNDALDGIQQLLERELRRARIAGTPAPGRQFTPREEIPHLIQIMQRLHGDHLAIDTHLPAQHLPLDRDDMLELIGNLLDNACKFANQQVQLSLTASEGGWQLHIEDDGPGVADDQLTELTHRGRRLDERDQGHGLGLAICHEIAESYGGSLTFSRSPLGGLAVDVWLPNPTADQVSQNAFRHCG